MTVDPSTVDLVLRVAVGVVLLPGAGVVATLLGARHYAVRARMLSAKVTTVLKPGPAVVHGAVDWAGAAEPPVEIAIEQMGEEREHKDTVTTRWTETRRSVTLRPFDVVTREGARIRVEPDPDARLVDELDEVQMTGTARRERRAILSRGEDVWIVGAFRPSASARAPTRQTAFRGATAGLPEVAPASRRLVLREHPLEPMLLSARPLGAARTARIWFHFGAAAVFAALAVLANWAFSSMPLLASNLNVAVPATAIVIVGAYIMLGWNLVPWFERKRLNERENGRIPPFVWPLGGLRVVSWLDAPRAVARPSQEGAADLERAAELEAELEADQAARDGRRARRS
ncbi:MAG: hypothetical protein IPM79_20580 [Polyangiaceae bacterium]|nr:hypothetical protein [Polyangiaceae bacterium]